MYSCALASYLARPALTTPPSRALASRHRRRPLDLRHRKLVHLQMATAADEVQRHDLAVVELEPDIAHDGRLGALHHHRRLGKQVLGMHGAVVRAAVVRLEPPKERARRA